MRPVLLLLLVCAVSLIVRHRWNHGKCPLKGCYVSATVDYGVSPTDQVVDRRRCRCCVGAPNTLLNVFDRDSEIVSRDRDINGIKRGL